MSDHSFAWFVLPVALVFIAALVGSAILDKIAKWRHEKRVKKWREERLRLSPMCSGCDADYHCKTHTCHCEREMTINGTCAQCGCDYWSY